MPSQVLLAQVQEAVTFLDKVSEQSPVLALLGAIILALIFALFRSSQQSIQRIERIADNFTSVMETASKRNHEISEKRLEASNQLTATMARLATLIENIRRD